MNHKFYVTLMLIYLFGVQDRSLFLEYLILIDDMYFSADFQYFIMYQVHIIFGSQLC